MLFVVVMTTFPISEPIQETQMALTGNKQFFTSFFPFSDKYLSVWFILFCPLISRGVINGYLFPKFSAYWVGGVFPVTILPIFPIFKTFHPLELIPNPPKILANALLRFIPAVKLFSKLECQWFDFHTSDSPIILRSSCINLCQFIALSLCHVLILLFLIHEKRIMY